MIEEGAVPELGVIRITHEVVEVGVEQRLARLRGFRVRLWVNVGVSGAHGSSSGTCKTQHHII